jgi:CheY-like chemotaxis protein
MSLLAVWGGAPRRGAGPLWCGAPPLPSYWGTNMTQGPAQRPVRVLVVDDHADVRFLLRAILADAAPAVVFAGEASGAEEALAALDALEPDVVVLDARMPRVDGFEAAEMLLARRPDLPILLCSALVDDDIRSRAETAGIAACLSKDHFEAIPRVVLELAGGSV